MTNNHRILDRFRDETAQLLSGPTGRRRLRAWGSAEPALAGVDPSELLAPCGGTGGQLRLRALVRLAADDDLAARAALAAVVPGLAAAANRLAQSWGADREETDQALINAGWERVRALAGHDLEWPGSALVAGARARVRSALVTDARRRRVDAGLRSSGVAPGPEDEIVGRRLLAEATARGVVALDDARLVWATRVLGYRLGELAGPGRAESSLRVRRWHTERALRAVA